MGESASTETWEYATIRQGARGEGQGGTDRERQIKKIKDKRFKIKVDILILEN